MKSIYNKILLATMAVTATGLLSSCFKKFDPNSYAPPLNIGGYTSSKEIAPANLVGYWSFNGSYVDSVSGQAGENAGTTFAPGVKGQAFQGGINKYVTFTPGAAITGMTSFTITYWVNTPVNSAGIAGLVNLSHNSNFWGNIDMFFENGSTADAAKFRAHIVKNGGTPEAWIAKDGIPGVFNTWTNFALSYDAASSTFKFYVNGNLSVTQVAAGYGPANFVGSGKLVFGTVHFMTSPSLTSSHGAEPWASFMTGMMDEIRIYNKALTDAEVGSLVKLEGRGK